MQVCNGFEVVYREMVDDEKGFFIMGSPMPFWVLDKIKSEAEKNVMPVQAAADAWACWMRSEGCEVLELPRTVRTCEWGLSYSVTARGEESRIFVISREH